MKRFIIPLVFAAAIWSCGEKNDDHSQEQIQISVSPENINASAERETFTVNVSTTGNEWHIGDVSDFIFAKAQDTTTSAGCLAITVFANPTLDERTGTVVIISDTISRIITVTQAAMDSTTYYVPDGYSLVWHDEFDGSELNTADWTHEVKSSGWVNEELQNYVNHKTRGGSLVTEVKDGRLHITCLKENDKIYSGRVYAKVRQGWKYGYIEGRIKLPKGKGTWPAFWMMPVKFTAWPDDGEIDIMEEVGFHPNYVSSSLHAIAHVHSNNTQVTHEMKCEGAEGEFHIYSVLWTDKNITTYVDGKVQLSYNNRGLGRDDWPYDDPFYVILNLAWGGTWGGMQGVDESALPATMEVDYVRVYQKEIAN